MVHIPSSNPSSSSQLRLLCTPYHICLFVYSYKTFEPKSSDKGPLNTRDLGSRSHKVYLFRLPGMCIMRRQHFVGCGCERGDIISLCEKGSTHCASPDIGQPEYHLGLCTECQKKQRKGVENNRSKGPRNSAKS